jgi:hypothetical protein
MKMRFLFAALATLFVFTASAQQLFLIYDYDGAGNVTNKSLVYIRAMSPDETVTNDSVPADPSAELEVGVYPNPTTGVVTITANHSSDSQGQVNIFDQNGSMVFSSVCSSQGTTFSLGELARGRYTIICVFGNQRKCLSLLKI